MLRCHETRVSSRRDGADCLKWDNGINKRSSEKIPTKRISQDEMCGDRFNHRRHRSHDGLGRRVMKVF